MIDITILCILILLAFVAYMVTLTGEFVFDDNEVLQSVRDSIAYPPKNKK